MKTDIPAESAYLLDGDNFEVNVYSYLSILWTKLKGLDLTQYPLLSQPLKLSVSAQFSFWEIAEHYIREYRRKK
ncbi:hypothetical protein RhiirA4_482971 [Rhizophagus irregularis]|uniref:Uncharacterized protein n=1 Tax=Rhizophagus irregularis TaxID=588596 RepID=A0A2I1HLU9_9GLOM|nr:hypothetical protein RhiirA4_482971 [Rhizophagus irregularis]